MCSIYISPGRMFLQVYLDVVTLFLLLLAFFSLTEGAAAAAAAPVPEPAV